MNILVTHREIDPILLNIFNTLSLDEKYNIFVAIPKDEEKLHKIEGNCVKLYMNRIKSKFTWNSIKDIRRIVKKHNIDIIFSVGSSGLSNALFATLGTKVINVAYRGTQHKIRRTDPTYYMGILNPRVDYVVCETEDIMTYLSKFISNKKLSFRPKPYMIDWVNNIKDTTDEVLPDNAFKLAYVGNSKNRPYKGLNYLIEAVILLNDKDIHLTIVGDYNDEDINMVKNSNMENNIHFMGTRSNAISYIKNKDLFVLPSLRDASPRVVREALACSVPCIVTNIPGARDLISPKCGVLVPAGDVKALAKEIKDLKDNVEKLDSLKSESQKHIIENFSVKEYTNYIARIFDNLYSEKFGS